ncbi:MAG: hypothetical protein CMF77_01240 [Candidatus Marinimicrobia bacterium]|jgi:uncharacterized protein YndB with AHSA1/START domain|nr:hypothetical protein [Candidatus Neomarinimicrobiota bacterium]MDP6457453.1 SRPBCC family protein [Candidatus Neomarinimicrobiota bacterium]
MLAGASIALLAVILYFIQQASQDQHLDLDCSVSFHPRATSAVAQMDVGAPAETVWRTLTDLANYNLWFPWIKRVRVTNESAVRWAHRHSLLEYRMEVGSRFKIKPFFGAPFVPCRFVTIDPCRTLSMEMRFFPFNREIVSFKLKPYTNCLEVNYHSSNNTLLGFITAAMFSWRGKDVLRNLVEALPEAPEAEVAAEAAPAQEKIIINDAFIDALVAKALADGMDLLNNITEKPLRAKAKSAYVKAKRAGITPDATPEAVEIVNQFMLGGGVPSTAASATELAPAAEVGEEARINQYVLKGLDGDIEIINAIEDRTFRAKVKSALVKAKRSGERPEVPVDAPSLDYTATLASTTK